MAPENAPHSTPLVFGEVLFDHFPDGSRVLGGAPFNVAWHLQGLGLDPLVVTAVGADQTGREAVESMTRWGMSTEGVQVDPTHPTGHVMAALVGGEPTFEIGAEQAYDYIDRAAAVSALSVRPTSLVYHGTLALRADRSWDAARGVLEATGGPTFVDLNLRSPWWTPDRLRWSLATATWLKLNRNELSTVSGGPVDDRDTCVEGASALADEHGLEGVIVTLGAEGALAVIDGRVYQAEAAPIPRTEMVDSVGAGDGFSAVACVGILRRWSPEALLDRGNSFAAELCRIRGATTEDRSVYHRHRTRWRKA